MRLLKLLSLGRCASVGMLLCLSTGANAGIINDLTSDWSTNAGLPVLTPEWELRGNGGVLLPAITDIFGLDFFPVLQPAFQADVVPAWFKSEFDGSQFTNPVNIDWQVGDVIVHTDESQGATSAVWTSGIVGIIDIGGSLWNPRDFGRAQEYTVTLNGFVLASGTVTDATDRNSREFFGLSSILVGFGDEIALNLTTQPNSIEDYLGVTFTVSDAVSVPEPGTLLLFVAGLLGIGLPRRRRHIA